MRVIRLKALLKIRLLTGFRFGRSGRKPAQPVLAGWLASAPVAFTGHLSRIILGAALAAYGIFYLQACDQLPGEPRVNQSWQELSAKAESAEQSGKLAEAEEIWQRALKLSEATKANSKQLNRSLHALGRIEFFSGNFARAKEHYLRLIAIKEREGIEAKASLPWNLSELGDVYYWLGDYELALEQYRRSAELYEQDGQMIGLAASLRKQADACARLNDDLQAIDLYKRADMFNTYAKQNPAFDAYAYMILDQEAQIAAERAELCRKTKHFELAMHYSREAERLWRRLAELPVKSTKAPFPSGRLVEIVLRATRKTKEQASIFEAAAPGLVATLEALAYEYCHAGMYCEAELLYRRLIELFNRVAEYNRQLQLDRSEFVSTLFKDWHACHQAVPILAEGDSQQSAGAKPQNAGNAGTSSLENPYLTEFRSIKHRQDRFEERARLWQKFGRAIPTRHALTVLKSYQPLFVVGTGVDYWTAMLRKLKVDLTAFTLSKEEGSRQMASVVRQLERQPASTLVILSAPPQSSFACELLSKYAGSKVIYIGQPAGLFGSDEDFFLLLAKQWKLKSLSPLPQWPEVYDVLSVYERKSERR